MPIKNEQYDRGLNLYSERNFEEAIEAFNLASKELPEDGESQLALSLSYQFLEQLDNAIESGKRAAELSPRDPLVYANLSRVYQRIGKKQEAEEALMMSQRVAMGM